MYIAMQVHKYQSSLLLLMGPGSLKLIVRDEALRVQWEITERPDELINAIRAVITDRTKNLCTIEENLPHPITLMHTVLNGQTWLYFAWHLKYGSTASITLRAEEGVKLLMILVDYFKPQEVFGGL